MTHRSSLARATHLLAAFALLLSLSADAARAQGDVCSAAETITFNASGEYCSGVVDNVSGEDPDFLIPSQRDLPSISAAWFRFVATQPEAYISVDARQPTGVDNPQFALISTDCIDVLSLESFAVDFYLNDGAAPFVDAYAYDLVVGQEYFIVVSGAALPYLNQPGGVGSFELCVRQQPSSAPAAADCDQAEIICDETIDYSVDAVRGNGAVANETPGDDCFDLVGGEYSPYWMKFRIREAGSLVFAIVPDDPTDDFDYALYRVSSTGDFNSCFAEETVRCMLSGPDPNFEEDEWANCSGATGVSAGALGELETVGCDIDPTTDEVVDNNFLQPVQAQAGDVYALLVHNSDRSGGGFTLTFDDYLVPGERTTAVFDAPTASYSSAEIAADCQGVTYEFEFTGERLPGVAVEYAWDFGPNAQPATETGLGPHRVVFTDDFDLSAVSVTTTTGDNGCTDVSASRAPDIIEVDATGSVGTPVVNPLDCDQPPTAATGSIVFPDPPAGDVYEYTLTPPTGAPVVQNTPAFTDLAAGTYAVSVLVSATCSPVVFNDLVIAAAPPIVYDPAADPTVEPLGCNAATASALLDDPARAAAQNRTYSVDGGPPQSEPLVTGLTPGATVQITVAEPGACPVTFPLAVPAAPTGPAVTATTTDTECGEPTGSLTAAVADPQPGASYEYSLDGGATFQASPQFDDLPAGAYEVVAREAGSTCASASFSATVQDSEGPAIAAADLTATPPSCAGAADGQIEVTGGPAGLEYSLDDGATFQAATTFAGLSADDYVLVARDADGCTTRLAIAVEEGGGFAPEFVSTDPACAQSGDGVIEFSGYGPDFEFAIDEVDGGAFRQNPTFADLDAGRYTLRVRGTAAPFCESDTVGVTLRPTIVEAEGIDLGEADVTLPYGEPFTLAVGELSGLGPDADYGYAFTGGDSLVCTDATCQTIVLVPQSSGTLTVTAVTPAGCEASGTLDVFVQIGQGVFLPTAFSPDGLGDPANEVWRPRYTAAVERVRSIRVFDRWGGLLYLRTDVDPADLDAGWDGTRMDSDERADSGVYVAQVVADIAGRERVITSDVTLLR